MFLHTYLLTLTVTSNTVTLFNSKLNHTGSVVHSQTYFHGFWALAKHYGFIQAYLANYLKL